MSEHDVDCGKSDEQCEEDCAEKVETDVEERAKVSEKIDDKTCATSEKETLNNEEEKEESCVDETIDQKPTISWEHEGEKFKVSWNLPEGTATSNDYVTLCYAGEKTF